jgi:hypothetical protein
MVEIGIVPTKYGYAAVGLRTTLGKQDVLEIHAPFPVSEELKTRILGNLAREIAVYLDEVGRWEGIGWAAFFWALVGGIALVADRIWQYSTSLILLYSWVRVWFLCDGLVLFLPWIAKTPHRRRAKKIQAYYGANNAIVLYQETNWPVWEKGLGNNEVEYIEEVMNQYPTLIPYYEQLLEKDPPWAFDIVPSTALKRIRNWILGPPIRLPHAIFYIGEL